MAFVTNTHTHRYQGRRIAFQHQLCNCTVVAHFPLPTGKKTLIVTEFQALVLLLFNGDDGIELDVETIAQKTGIEEGEVKRVLQALAMGKVEQRVLRRCKKGEKDIVKGEKFSFNTKFKNNNHKIKIYEVRLVETVQENEKINALIENDRKHQLDAIIVRCMKTRKTMIHSELMAEVIRQAKYDPENSAIKKRIETLIEREYMERSETAKNAYNYLA